MPQKKIRAFWAEVWYSVFGQKIFVIPMGASVLDTCIDLKLGLERAKKLEHGSRGIFWIKML